MNELELPALDGANPLGFLAALGTLAVLSETDPTIKLGWRSRARWVPYLVSERPLDASAIVTTLGPRLRGRPVSESAQADYSASRKAYLDARKKVKDAKQALTKLGLRGKERDDRYAKDITPLEQQAEAKRRSFLERLSAAVPSLELSVGDKIDLGADEFREKAGEFLDARGSESFSIQMLASFASEGNDGEKCRRTDFDFVDSSGQLAFLKAVRELTQKVTDERLHQCLFHPWRRVDEKLSLRFDPVEDRRYALLDRDPTANDNKSRSEWMANLLAYQALRFFPCALTARGPATAGWNVAGRPKRFTWPIWHAPIGPSVIRSLFVMTELHDEPPPTTLRQRGVAAVYKALRVENGDYVNFSPANAAL